MRIGGDASTGYSVNPTTGDISLSFNSIEGLTYAVFASPSMKDGTWAGVIDNVQPQGDTTTVNFRDSFAAGVAQRFYRVEVE